MCTTGRRGAALIVVLGLCALLSVSAIALFSTAHLDTLIAGNVRRHTQAGHAAASGMHHLMSLNIPVPNLVRALREQSVASATVLQPTLIPGTRTRYRVDVSLCCDARGGMLPEDTLLVISTGELIKGGRPIAVAQKVATIKWLP